LIFLEQPVESAAADPQRLRRVDLVALRLLERGEHGPPFEIVQFNGPESAAGAASGVS